MSLDPRAAFWAIGRRSYRVRYPPKSHPVPSRAQRPSSKADSVSRSASIPFRSAGTPRPLPTGRIHGMFVRQMVEELASVSGVKRNSGPAFWGRSTHLTANYVASTEESLVSFFGCFTLLAHFRRSPDPGGRGHSHAACFGSRWFIMRTRCWLRSPSCRKRKRITAS